MKREILYLEADRFTTTSACAREVIALMIATDYKIVIRATKKQVEELNAELEPVKDQWRINVQEINS
jgi:hypothetical protein